MLERHDLLGMTAPFRRGTDAVAGLHPRHARRAFGHDARNLGAGREGQRRLGLVLAGGDQRRREADAGGVDRDPHATRPHRRTRHLLQGQRHVVGPSPAVDREHAIGGSARHGPGSRLDRCDGTILRRHVEPSTRRRVLRVSTIRRRVSRGSITSSMPKCSAARERAEPFRESRRSARRGAARDRRAALISLR